MLSRRNLRIKVMQALFSKTEEHGDFRQLSNLLKKNMENAFNMYYIQLLYIMAVCDYSEVHLERIRNKHLPSPEEQQASNKLANNAIIQVLREHAAFGKIIKDNKLHNYIDQDLVKKLYLELFKKERYRKYMADEARSFEGEKDIIIFFIKRIMYDNRDLVQAMEEEFINTSDDIDTIHFTLHKQIAGYKENQPNPFLKGLSGIDEEKKFALQLLDDSLLHYDQLTEEVMTKLKNWEPDRVAKIDMILMQMAICEFLYCPTVPVKVTINEYVDIAKYYSTPKSKEFVNGVIDRAMKDLKERGLINKTGRGLVEF